MVFASTISMKKRKLPKVGNSWFFTAISISILASFMVFNQDWSDDWNYNWKGIRPEIKDSAKQAIAMGIYPNTTRGYVIDNSSISELEQLTQYPLGDMRALAYEALLKRQGYSKKIQLLQLIEKEEGYCSYINGCIREELPIKNYIFNYIIFNRQETAFTKNKKLWSNEEKQWIIENYR